jgi:hypothetical protein
MAKEPALDLLSGQPHFRLMIMDLNFPADLFGGRETVPSNLAPLARILHSSEPLCSWSQTSI